MKCNQCEYINKDDALFCTQCGAPLKEEEELTVVEELVQEEVKEEIEEVFTDNQSEELVEDKHEEPVEKEETIIVEDEKIYCQICQNEIYESTVICPHCGSATGKTVPVQLVIEDKENIGLNLLSLFVPVLGILSYFIFREKLPKLTKKMAVFGLIGLIIMIVSSGLAYLPEMFKDTCSYVSSSEEKCDQEVYQDGYCEYHYFIQQNPFFQNF